MRSFSLQSGSRPGHVSALALFIAGASLCQTPPADALSQIASLMEQRNYTKALQVASAALAAIGRCVLRARWPGVAPRPNERTGGLLARPVEDISVLLHDDARRKELSRRAGAKNRKVLSDGFARREVYPLADHCQFDILQSGPGW